MNKGEYSICVVDDEPEIRQMLVDYLQDSEGYRVCSANCGDDALKRVLPSTKVDLILSDINMPGMRGFELLNRVRERYPAMKRMLITAYNVEDYFELALTHDVGNIFVKSSPFNFRELSTSLENLLTSNIFGLERYFQGETAHKGPVRSIRHGLAIHATAHEIATALPRSERSKKLEVVLVELLTNALFYGARDENPDDKGKWDHDYRVPHEDAIVVSTMIDTDRYAISVVDNGGKLCKRDILYWLNRQSTHDENGLPMGVFDCHGRGLFIARRYIDRVIINIDRTRKTEIIILNYTSHVWQGSKPLYINEL